MTQATTIAAIGGFFGAVSFGTYGVAAGAAAGLGLGAVGSFAFGSLASLTASWALTSVFGDDNSSLSITPPATAFASQTAKTVDSMTSNDQSATCQAGKMNGGGLMFAGGVMIGF